MTSEKMAEMVFEHSKKITEAAESIKSAHKRIDNFDKVADSINELSKNIGLMTGEIKLLTHRLDSDVKEIKTVQKNQGEQIQELREMPGKKATTFADTVKYIVVSATIATIVTAVVTYFLVNLGAYN